MNDLKCPNCNDGRAVVGYLKSHEATYYVQGRRYDTEIPNIIHIFCGFCEEEYIPRTEELKIDAFIVDEKEQRLKLPYPVPDDGVACYHPGCLKHYTHPCEGCGRIAGKSDETTKEWWRKVDIEIKTEYAEARIKNYERFLTRRNSAAAKN